ncbi:unnamed protein product, partial [marine sediment metagenome]
YSTKTIDAEGHYFFIVPADDPDTPAKDGAYAGDLIEFLVDGVSVATSPFEIGGLTKLDLTVTITTYALTMAVDG